MRKEFPSIPPVLKSSEALRMLILDLDDSISLAVMAAEHLRLPSVQDVREGVIASKIAAHAADLANGVPGARDWDDRMARARQRLDWPAMFDEAIDRKKAEEYVASTNPHDPSTCTMCGAMCSVRTMNKAMKGENVSLL